MMPGEYPATTLLSDAQHWCSVYRQLLTTKEVLLLEVNDALARTSTSVDGEPVVDGALLEHQARLQRQLRGHRLRLSYWLPRRDELSLQKGSSASSIPK